MPRYQLPQSRVILPNIWDILALFIITTLLILLAQSASHMSTPYHLGEKVSISLDPINLPHYALRTTIRMFIALFISILFSFIFGTLAAKYKSAEKIIIPAIDILQSIPILGFLSITVVGFIKLFPNSLLGPECAAIFAIFTSQAWNMILSFYQSLISIPEPLREAASIYQLSAWQKFWKMEVPFAIPSFLWNTMMSLSGGWFFVVASEAITVSNQSILLPGIGSYIAVALQQQNLTAVTWAIATMLIVILLYDQLMLRPALKWSEKFTYEESSSEQFEHSWVYTLIRRAKLIQWMIENLSAFFNYLVNLKLFRKKTPERSYQIHFISNKWSNFTYYSLLGLLITGSLIFLLYTVFLSVTFKELILVFGYGGITAIKVIILIILCSLIWIPIGIWIGLNPTLTKFAQPLAQFLAAFPANVLYPIVVYLIINYQLNVNIWTAPLMILGTQWYILFNIIAGAKAIPRDLYLVGENLHVKGWLWWKKIAIPAIFPYFITGAMTAAGGAWNASVIAEVINWGSTTLTATGIGAYINEYTAKGDFSRIVLGMTVMCIYVLTFNRLIWQKLYKYAQTHYRLD